MTSNSMKLRKTNQRNFNGELLSDYKMQWALTSCMIINGKYRCYVNSYKLASKSDLFKHLLRLNGRNSDFHYQTESIDNLEMVLRYCHLDECELTLKNIEQILEIAHNYRIKDLMNLCDSFIRSNINDDLCWNWWLTASNLNEISLNTRQFIDEYVLKNFIRASFSKKFLLLDDEQLLNLMMDDRLNIENEYNLIDVVSRWIEFDLNQRNGLVNRLMSGVRLGLFSLEQVETLWKSQMLKRTQSTDCLTSIRQARRSLVRNKRNLRPLDKCGVEMLDLSALGCARPRYPHEAIFVFGGWEAGAATRAVRVYDNRAKQWISYTNSRDNNIVLPRALMSFGIALLNKHQVLILGGEVQSQQATQEVLCYDLTKKIWQQKAPMHEIRRDLVAVNLNDEAIYAIGGDNNKSVLDSVEKFLPQRNQWLEVAPMLLMRSAPAADCVNGKIYVLGGYTESQMEALTASCECYDPTTDQWSYIKPMSQPRYYFNALIFDGHLYVLGGGDETQWSTVERYSPSYDCWVPMPSLLQQRADFAACLLEGEFYCLGGGGDSFCTAEVEHWQPSAPQNSTNPWQRGPSLPCPTWGHRCVTVSGVNVILPYLKSCVPSNHITPLNNQSGDLIAPVHFDLLIGDNTNNEPSASTSHGVLLDPLFFIASTTSTEETTDNNNIDEELTINANIGSTASIFNNNNNNNNGGGGGGPIGGGSSVSSAQSALTPLQLNINGDSGNFDEHSQNLLV